jgi:hypothetical protein
MLHAGLGKHRHAERERAHVLLILNGTSPHEIKPNRGDKYSPFELCVAQLPLPDTLSEVKVQSLLETGRSAGTGWSKSQFT